VSTLTRRRSLSSERCKLKLWMNHLVLSFYVLMCAA
jgi:hypothetical protein